jgi:hypothetical protein
MSTRRFGADLIFGLPEPSLLKQTDDDPQHDNESARGLRPSTVPPCISTSRLTRVSAADVFDNGAVVAGEMNHLEPGVNRSGLGS